MTNNLDEILTVAANGNQSALYFLRAYAQRAHWVDDVQDGQMLRSPASIAASETDWLLTLTANHWFLAHREKLVPLMLAGLNAWADSHRFPPAQRDVIKGIWHETVWAVALITGGPEYQRQLTAKYREYDVEPDAVAAPVVVGLKPCSCGDRDRCDRCVGTVKGGTG